MIRVILFFLSAALVWILLFSKFTQRQRIVGAIALFVVSVVAMWLTAQYDKPRSGVITAANVEVCDFSMAYSYRTNYDLVLCLKNTHESATLRRIEFEVTAKRCPENQTEQSDKECTVVQSVSKSRPLTIKSGQTLTIQDSLDFDQVPEEGDPSINWTIDILTTRAVN